MFKEYGPHEEVPAGTYFNRANLEFVHIGEEGDRLDGGEGARFYRVPVLTVLALGPVIGLAFILFLPLAVPIVGANALFRAIRKRLSDASRRGGSRQVPVVH